MNKIYSNSDKEYQGLKTLLETSKIQDLVSPPSTARGFCLRLTPSHVVQMGLTLLYWASLPFPSPWSYAFNAMLYLIN